MNLSEYIENIGVEAFATKFKVKERTAHSWKVRDRFPRPEMGQQIVAASPVTWEGIYGVSRRVPSSGSGASA